MLQVTWLALGVVILVAAPRAGRSHRALQTGLVAVSALYVGAGALVNAFFLLRGDNYAKFADGAYIRFVRDTWRSLVVPNHAVFISLLIAFEVAVGVLVLAGGRLTQLGLVGTIAFHIALLSFGWGFYLWSVPMLVALTLLFRAQRHLTPPRRSVAEAQRVAA